MSRKRASAPSTGDLFDREGRARARKPAPTRRRRGARAGPALDALAEAPAPDAAEPLRVEEPGAEPVPETFFDVPARDFEMVGGIHLTNSILWCDADRKRDLVFLSHAHQSYVGKNRRVLATDKTLKILTRNAAKADALTTPYRRPFTLGPLRLEMHPAGHVLGSAQLLIERDDRRLVFACDVQTRRSVTAERASPVPCDVLVLPPSYGLPLYRFPPREEVLEQIVDFIDRAFDDQATPILLANPIGTAQEMIARLGAAGYRMRVHGSIYDVAKIYRSTGLPLGGCKRFAGVPARDEVVIFPPILKRHAAIRKLRKSRVAMLTGRAVEPGFLFQQKVTHAFPWSDTVDHAELHEFVKGSGAREVYLYGDRHVDEFGAELRARGIKVFPLVHPKQLSLL